MALPAITPYAMPSAADLPANTVAWAPDPQRAALLIHDMQRYFLAAYSASASPVVELVANIDRLRQQCAALNIPVIYSAQPGGQTPAQRGLLQDFWGAGIGSDGDQQQIVDALAPAAHDILLQKWRYSAFQRTELLDLLQRQGRDQLLICGIYAHIGCLMTACDAFMHDIQPFLIADAVADFSLADHHMALRYAAQRCAVVTSTKALLTAFGGAQERDSASTASAPDADLLTFQRVCEDVADVLQEPVSAIDVSLHPIDLGLDSIRVMSLVERWRRVGVEVSFMELVEQPTLMAWWELLRSRSPQSAAAGAGSVNHGAVDHG